MTKLTVNICSYQKEKSHLENSLLLIWYLCIVCSLKHEIITVLSASKNLKHYVNVYVAEGTVIQQSFVKHPIFHLKVPKCFKLKL